MRASTLLVPAFVLLLTGCGCEGPSTPDAGEDAGLLDAGEHDAGEPDAGSADGGEADAGGLDGGGPDAGEGDAGAGDAGPGDAGALDGGGPTCGTLDELEPNDAPTQATVLLDGGLATTEGTFLGELQHGDDLDWFVFHVEAPATVLRLTVDVGASVMDARLWVTGPTGATTVSRYGSNPLGLGVTREVFFPLAGDYRVSVRDQRAVDGAAPAVTPGTFCYALTLARVALPASLPRLDLPVAAGVAVGTHTVTANGNLGFFLLNTANDVDGGGLDVLRPLVFDLTAPPAAEPTLPDGGTRQPDVDPALLVWDVRHQRVVGEGDEAGAFNSNANAVALLSSAGPTDYWVIVDHVSLRNTDLVARDGGVLHDQLTLSVTNPVPVPSLPFLTTAGSLTYARQVQWYLVQVAPPALHSALADWTPSDLVALRVGVFDLDGQGLAAGAPGPTSALASVAVQSDRSLVAVWTDDDLVRTSRTAAYSLTLPLPVACPPRLGAQAPTLGDLVLNEVLYDPPLTGGDANGDGVRDARDDEFVEFVNQTNKLLDLSGVAVLDVVAPAAPRHAFPCGTTLSPGEPLVLFGGGFPPSSFGSARVATVNLTGACSGALRSLCLQNSTSEGIALRSATDGGLLAVTFNAASGFVGATGEPDQAWVRCASDAGLDCDSSAAGGVYLRHGTVPAAGGRLHSPGLRVDGSEFVFGQSCAAAYPVTLVSGAAAAVDTTAGFASRLDGYATAGGGACTGFPAGAGERVYAVPVGAGQRLTVTATPADTTASGPDLALYLLDAAGCAASTPVCLAGADSGGPGQSDTVQWNNPGAATTVYVAVDGAGPATSGPFSIGFLVN